MGCGVRARRVRATGRRGVSPPSGAGSGSPLVASGRPKPATAGSGSPVVTRSPPQHVRGRHWSPEARHSTFGVATGRPRASHATTRDPEPEARRPHATPNPRDVTRAGHPGIYKPTRAPLSTRTLARRIPEHVRGRQWSPEARHSTFGVANGRPRASQATTRDPKPEARRPHATPNLRAIPPEAHPSPDTGPGDHTRPQTRPHGRRPARARAIPPEARPSPDTPTQHQHQHQPRTAPGPHRTGPRLTPGRAAPPDTRRAPRRGARRRPRRRGR